MFTRMFYIIRKLYLFQLKIQAIFVAKNVLYIYCEVQLYLPEICITYKLYH